MMNDIHLQTFFQRERYSGPTYYSTPSAWDQKSIEEDTYYRALLEEVYMGVMNTGGKAFSFEVPICTKYGKYESYKPLFSREKKIKRSEKYTENLKNFQSAFSKMPSGISCTNRETTFEDSKEENRSVNFVLGYTVVVNVDKGVSSQIFNERYAEGSHFKEKLLCEHKEILRECNATIMRGTSKPHYSRCPTFWVQSDGVRNEKEDTIIFRHLGMLGLTTTAERFGFGMAMIELGKMDGIIKENDKYIFKDSGETIIVGLYEEKNEPSLKAW